MLSHSSHVPKLYLSIIDDVIESMREVFLDEGLEDRVLDDLRQLWESKILQSKAVDGLALMKNTINSSNFVLQLPPNYGQTFTKPAASMVIPAGQHVQSFTAKLEFVRPQFTSGNMVALSTRQQKELAGTIQEIVCVEITCALDLPLKPLSSELFTLQRHLGGLTHAGKRISIYPDLRAELLKQRETYNENTTHTFSTAKEAQYLLEKHIKLNTQGDKPTNGTP